MMFGLRAGSAMFFLFVFLYVQLAGHGLGKLILPRRFKDDLPLLAPLLGVGATSLLTGYLSYLGISCEAIRWAVPPALVLLGVVSLRKEDLLLYHRWVVAVLCVGVLGGMVVLFPSLLWNGVYPYTDQFTYISIADYLRNHGFFDKALFDFFHPFHTQVALYQTGFRMGTQFFLGVMSAVAGVPFSIELFLPVVAMGHVLFVLGLWLLCRRTLRMGEASSIIACLLAACNFSLLIKNAYMGFFPQAFGMAIFIFLIVWLFSETPHCWDWQETVFGGVLSGLLIFSYAELVPFWCLVVALFLLSKFKSGTPWVSWVGGIMGTGLISVFINPIATWGMVRVLPRQFSAVVGWNVPLSLWEAFQAFLSLHRLEGPANSLAVWHGHLILFGIVQGVSLVCFGILLAELRYDKNIFSRLFPLGISLLPILGMAFRMATCKMNPFSPGTIGQSWSVYKCLQYGYFAFPPLLACSLGQTLVWGKRKGLFLSIIILVPVLGAGIVGAALQSKSQVQLLQLAVGRREQPLEAYFDLRKNLPLHADPVRVLIPPEYHKHRQMVAYFLQDRRIAADWENDGYICNTLPPAPPGVMDQPLWTLAFDRPGQGSLLPCRLSLLSPEMSAIQWSFGGDWYPLEQDSSGSWHWSKGTGQVHFLFPLHAGQNLTLSLSCLWADPESMKGKKILVEDASGVIGSFTAKHPGWNEVLLPLTVSEVTKTLVFRYQGNAVKLDPDPRELAFAFKNLNLQPRSTKDVHDLP